MSGFKVVSHWLYHPLSRATGRIVLNRRTGLYCFHTGAAFLAVPQRWAQRNATGRR